MAMDWFRSWHNAPTDPKWLVIAQRTRTEGVTPGMVSAVAWALMDYASQNADRGSVDGFDAETYAAFTGWCEDQIEAIIEAMRGKGMITPDGRLAAWDKRQPKREDSSTERVRRHRETKRVTNALPDSDNDVTQSNAMKRDVTQSNHRSDQIRSDQKRDEGIERPAVVVNSPFPENDPDWSAAISKLEAARIGGMNGQALIELSALWPELTNGYRAWLDDAITVAQANKAKSPVYAVRVLANALSNNERPGQVPERKTGRQVGHTAADLDAIFGVDIHGNPV